MSGLKILSIGLIAIFIGAKSWCYEGTIAIKGNPFDYVTRGVIQLFEKSQCRYEITDDIVGKDVVVNLDNMSLLIHGKVISLSYRYEDIFGAVLAEKRENWEKVAFLLKENTDNNYFFEFIKRNGLKYYIIKDQKDFEKKMSMVKKDKKISRLYYVAVGEGRELLKEIILPISFMRNYDNLKVMLIAKKICGELSNIDFMGNLKNTELYSFISCIDLPIPVIKLTEMLDGHSDAAIISLEIKNFIDQELFNKNVENWYIYAGYRIDGGYTLELKGYTVVGGTFVPVDLTKQIELK